MSCIKTCKCNECEMLIRDEPIVFIKKRGFKEKRMFSTGFKCMYTGKYALKINELKKSKMLNDEIFLE